jgi:hypothetical protein
MGSASTLPAPALAASRAALNAAFADQQSAEPVKADADASANGTETAESAEVLEPGEIQEVDMQAQAEEIRTVFSDATNFNVKVRVSSRSCNVSVHRLTNLYLGQLSTLCTPHGLSGLILRPQKAVICRRHLYLGFPRPRCPRRLVRQSHWVGWKISSESSALTVWRSFGGEHLTSKLQSKTAEFLVQVI